MKKFYSLLTAATFGLLTLTACSSDDNSPQPDETDLLIGKWDMQTMDMLIQVDGEILVDEEDVPTKEAGIIIQYDFKEDKTVEYYLFTPATAGQEEAERSGTGTYEKNETELILTLENSPTVYSIFLLEKNELHLNMTEEEENNKLSMTQKFIKM